MRRSPALLLTSLLAAACRPGAAQLPLVKQTEVPFGAPRAVALAENRAYVANGQGGLVIVDLSSAKVLGRWFSAEPGHRSSGRQWIHELGGEADQVAVFGNSAFLLLQRRGYDSNRTRVARLDISDPAHPRLLSSFLLRGTASELAAVDAEHALVLRQPGGTMPPNEGALLSLVELNDNPHIQSNLASSAAYQHLAWNKGRVALSGSDRIQFVDWKETPAWAGNVTQSATSLAYGTDGTLVTPQNITASKVFAGGLGITDEGFILNGKRGKLDFVAIAGASDGSNTVFLDAQGLRVLHQGSWLKIPTAGDPQRLLPGPRAVGPDEPLTTSDGQQIPQAEQKFPGARAIAVQGNLQAAAAGRKGVALGDGSRFYDDKQGRMDVRDVAFQGSDLALADADNGVTILDMTNPQKPVVKKSWALPNALGLAWQDATHLWVANGVYGVALIDLLSDQIRTLPMRDCRSVLAQDGKIFALDCGTIRECQSSQMTQILPRLEYSGTALIPMGIPRHLAVHGNTAWISNDEGWNLVGIDLTDLQHPALQQILSTGGFTRGVACLNDTVLATTQRNFLSYQLPQPNPTTILPVKWPGSVALNDSGPVIQTGPSALQVDSKKVFPAGQALSAWGQWTAGSDGKSLQLYGAAAVAQIPLPNITASAGENERLCVASGSELHWLHVPLLDQDVHVTVPGSVRAVAVHENLTAFAGDVLGLIEGISLIAQTDPLPNAGTYDSRKPHFLDVSFFERGGQTYLAALDAYYGLRIYDKSLRQLGRFATSGGDYAGITVDPASGQVYVGNNWGGLYRIQDGQAHRLETSSANPGCAGPLARDGKVYFQGNTDRTLYCAQGDQIANLGRPPAPSGISDERRFGLCFPDLRGSLLYTPAFSRIFDVSDPARAVLKGECLEAGYEHDNCVLATLQGKLYNVLTGPDALTLVDVHDPAHPQVASRLPGDFLGGYYFARGIQIEGSQAYICNRAQLNIVDLADPAHPRLRSQIELQGSPCDVAIREGVAYVAGYYGGLEIVDVHDPDRPVRISHVERGYYHDNDAWDNSIVYPCLAWHGNQLYVGEYYSGLQTWSWR